MAELRCHEIPRPAGKSAGLRDDAHTIGNLNKDRNYASVVCFGCTNIISKTSRLAPITIALSARLNTGQR